EVRPLAEHFGRLGCTVEAPVLAGHGGTLADLAATRWSDWLRSAETALEGLERRTGRSPTAICGFSMGGLLALRLARLFPGRVSGAPICRRSGRPRWSCTCARTTPCRWRTRWS